MIKPTVGRVLWYRCHKDDARPHASEQPLASMVTHVNEDGTVNLVVFDAVGVPFSCEKVMLLQDDDPHPKGGGFAEWMPYQKGQAAKTEEAEKKSGKAKE